MALVSGAASGIGHACVRQLAFQGAAVVALDINPDITQCFSQKEVLGIRCDVTNSKHVKKAITHQYSMEFNNTLYEKTSLLHYRVVKENTFQPSYLKCQNVGFKAIQLKFKLRAGVSGIGEDLYRQHCGTGMCSFCGEFESLKHVLLQCHAYQYERQKMISNIKDNCDEATFSLFLEDSTFAMYNVLGDHDNLFNKPFLMYLL